MHGNVTHRSFTYNKTVICYYQCELQLGNCHITDINSEEMTTRTKRDNTAAVVPGVTGGVLGVVITLAAVAIIVIAIRVHKSRKQGTVFRQVYMANAKPVPLQKNFYK